MVQIGYSDFLSSNKLDAIGLEMVSLHELENIMSGTAEIPNPKHWMWDPTKDECQFSFLWNGEKYFCRISREFLEDKFGLSGDEKIYEIIEKRGEEIETYVNKKMYRKEFLNEKEIFINKNDL